MAANPFIVPITALAIVSGMFSPLLLPQSVAMIIVLAPGLLIASPSLVFFFSALLGATATIMIAGVPAALFERLTGRGETDTTSYTIWLAGTALLSVPAFLQAASQFL